LAIFIAYSEVWLCINELFVMLLLSGMVGDHLTSLSPVLVASLSLLTIHFTVPLVFFPTVRHNEIRNVTANLLSQVCSNIQIGPNLQPLSCKILSHSMSHKSILLLEKMKIKKRHHYVRNIEYGTFTPLVFLGPIATTFYT